MPKFTKQEMDRINEEIMNKSKVLFTDYGLKKTSIDDIVQACNIGKGTFYRFYQSKEELYFKILEREEQFRIVLMEEMFKSKKIPKEAFKDFLIASFEYIETNPFLYRILERQDVEMLYRKLPKETLENHFNHDLKDVLLLIEKWRHQNILKDEDPEVLTGILQSLFLMYTFKNELGKVFPKVFHKLIDYIVNGMFI